MIIILIIILIIIFLYIIFYILNIILKKNNLEKFDNNINIDNLFTYCINDIDANDVYYYIDKNNIGNSLMTLAISNNKILCNSNEYLSLIKLYYPTNTIIYYKIVDIYKYIINNLNNNIIISDNVLSFITTFSTGTNHGYGGLFYIINEYIKDYEKYKDYKIIVYKNSQKGILDIINYLKDTNIIKNDIIYIDSDIIYKFNKFVIIPNKQHVIEPIYALEISNTIEKYLIKPNFNIIYNKICIIKSSLSQNVTNISIVDINIVNNFSNKNNLVLIEPTNYNETDFINILYNCNLLVLSWGTTFFKNYYYISDKCEKIIILVIGDSKNEYNQYMNTNALFTKFRNATFEYIITDNLDNITI